MSHAVDTARQANTGQPSHRAGHARLQEVFDAQKRVFLDDPSPNCKQRIADLDALKQMLVENRDALTKAIAADYGCRSWHETTFDELIAVLGSID